MSRPELALESEYRRRFQDSAEYRADVWAILCKDYFSRLVAPDSKLLDVGCGWGEFVNQIAAKEKHGMDLNSDSGQRLAPDVHFIHQDCSAPWPFPDSSLDVVFSSNFLEHLADKAQVERLLSEALRALRSGGTFILMGPNIRYLPGAYWDFWDHRVAISDASLVEVLELTGFRIVERVDRFLPYTMSGGHQVPLGLVRAYLKLPFLWRVLGKQFLIVGRKP